MATWIKIVFDALLCALVVMELFVGRYNRRHGREIAREHRRFLEQAARIEGVELVDGEENSALVERIVQAIRDKRPRGEAPTVH